MLRPIRKETRRSIRLAITLMTTVIVAVPLFFASVPIGMAIVNAAVATTKAYQQQTLTAFATVLIALVLLILCTTTATTVWLRERWTAHALGLSTATALLVLGFGYAPVHM